MDWEERIRRLNEIPDEPDDETPDGRDTDSDSSSTESDSSEEITPHVKSRKKGPYECHVCGYYSGYKSHLREHMCGLNGVF